MSNTPTSTETTPKEGSFVQLLIDMGPLAVFLIVYQTSERFTAEEPIIVATGALIIATLLALTLSYARTRSLAVMPLVTGAMVTIFGGLTIWLNDEQFIKVKPTLVNLLFALTLLVGLQLKKPLLKVVLGQALDLREPGWSMLSFRWALFFIFLAAVNELIWRNFSTDFWVSFKVFGMMTMTILFTLSQLPLMGRYSAAK